MGRSDFRLDWHLFYTPRCCCRSWVSTHTTYNQRRPVSAVFGSWCRRGTLQVTWICLLVLLLAPDPPCAYENSIMEPADNQDVLILGPRVA